ncbi:hypothetical protein HAX54_005089 [Datura stramonium]|uniref:Uncharacterized protein n=1 Tax=Datura stramonium TaxID=4076 RepID=A0ABS8T9J0_DATST|nr:hypothetical protein [Datura stramonium]
MMKCLHKRLGKLWPAVKRRRMGKGAKVYEDFCLRYQNENCKRAFHALPIMGPPLPPEVAEKGENYCLGFSVLGTEGKSPVVRKNEDDVDGDEVIEIFDNETEDENGRKEESVGK